MNSVKTQWNEMKKAVQDVKEEIELLNKTQTAVKL